MNPPKVTDEDYINFIIATPRDVTATEAGRVQPESRDAPAHDAFTRLLARLEPDAETLWQEARTRLMFTPASLFWMIRRLRNRIRRETPLFTGIGRASKRLSSPASI